MQKPIASLMAVGLLLLAACSTAEVEPGPITSFDDIAGTTYERQDPGKVHYFHFFGDGTWNTSSNPDLVEDRPGDVYETRFEGRRCFCTKSRVVATTTPTPPMRLTCWKTATCSWSPSRIRAGLVRASSPQNGSRFRSHP